MHFHSNAVLQISKGIDDVSDFRTPLIGCLFTVWLLLFLGLLRGIQNIGKFSYVTAISPYIILAILLSMTLDKGIEGIKYFLTPKWSRLTDLQVWVDSATQVLFSLSI